MKTLGANCFVRTQIQSIHNALATKFYLFLFTFCLHLKFFFFSVSTESINHKSGKWICHVSSCVSQQAVETVPSAERGQHGQRRQVDHHSGASAAVESVKSAVAGREPATASGEDCVNVISSLFKNGCEIISALYQLNVSVAANPSRYTCAGISSNRKESTA